jgi:hypothetical protein
MLCSSVAINQFFFANSSVRELDTRVNFKRSSTYFSLMYSSRSFQECTALCSRLLKVGRENFGKICPPTVGTDTFISVIEQTLPFKTFPFIPCEHPISTLSIILDDLDVQDSVCTVARLTWLHLTFNC